MEPQLDMESLNVILPTLAGVLVASIARRHDRRAYAKAVLVAGITLIERRKVLQAELRLPMEPSEIPEVQRVREDVRFGIRSLVASLDSWCAVLVPHGTACTAHIKKGAEWPEVLSPMLYSKAGSDLFCAELLLTELRADLAHIEAVANGSTNGPQRPAWTPRVVEGGADDAGAR